MSKVKYLGAALIVLIAIVACSQSQNQLTTSTSENMFTDNLNDTNKVDSSGWNKLTPEEERVIVYKGTEMIWKGEYTNNHEKGTYLCKRCNIPLFDSDMKFDSGSGWPAFDDCIDGAVTEVPDADGYRTEIVCSNCNGHLGHVFKGERFTKKNTRHCVNSISMQFVSE